MGLRNGSLLELPALAVALILVGCHATVDSTEGGDAPATPGDPVFVFLAERYDADGDGRITPDEYDREGGDFARLDRDEDGVLTASDFAKTGRRVRVLSPREERRRHAVAVLGWYFQADDDPERLAAAELEEAFAAYDADGNGRVGRREFESVAAIRKGHGVRPGGKYFGLLEVETTDPWERVLRGVDGDDDGFLTAKELLAFHADSGTPETWTFEADVADAPVEALEGRPAPDFTLSTVDGTRRITLSDFAGDRPVALIFGSWT